MTDNVPARPREFNCFECKFYQPSVQFEFQGLCARKAPSGETGSFVAGPASVGAEIVQPAITWCGDFEKWLGEPREQGTCPYPPAAEE